MKMKQLVVTVAALAGMAAVSMGQTGLVGYFPLNGNGNDASTYLNHGTVSGGTPTSNRFGVAGQAMLFTGGYVEIPDAPQYSIFNTNFAVTVHFKTTDIPTGGVNDNRMIFEKRQAGNNRRADVLVYTGGKVTIHLEGEIGTKTVTSPTVLADGNWHHVGFVRESDMIKMYVDGGFVGSNSAPTSAVNNVGPIRIGKAVQDYNYNGSIDEVRIYNRALSPAEISDFYRADLPSVIGVFGSLAFGKVWTGQVAVGALTITNSGLGALTVTNIDYPSGFSGAWTGIVAASAATNITVNFSPASTGNYGGTIRVYSTATSGSNTVSCSGTGIVTHAANATPVVTNGFVIAVTVMDGGAGYTNPPLVRIIGGGGTNAAAVAVVSNGIVTAVNVMNAGIGYTGTPIVVISPPFIQQPLADKMTMVSLLTSTNLGIGTNYQLQALQAAVWTNIGSAFTASSSTYSAYSAYGAPNAFRLALTPTPGQAFASAQVVNGFIVGVNVSTGGWGYVTNPAVEFACRSGSNATAKANIAGGSVSSINIINPGSGYTNAVTVQIEPPPAVAVFPDVTPVMKVIFGRLSPYDNYELESVAGLGDVWNTHGGLVVPTSTTNTFYIPATNLQGFFRAHYVP